MNRGLKILGYVVGALLIVIVIGVGGIYAVSASKMSKGYSKDVEKIAIPTDPVSIARGKHLVEAVGKCQGCHGDKFAGTMMFEGGMFANLTTANLTNGKDGIAGQYTDDDWVRAIRYGVGRDGKTLLFMPTKGYTVFNDADLSHMIAYLKTLPAADTTLERKRSIGPIARAISLFTPFPLYSATYAEKGPRTVIAEGVTPEYGKYLIDAGVCRECHGDNLGGSKDGPAPTPNITKSGALGKWTPADFVKVLRTGVRPDGRTLSTIMPWQLTKNLNDTEIAAMWAYLQSIPGAPAKK